MSEAERIGAEELYRAHAPFVAAFLARLGVSHADLADLVQEVFLIAHRRGGFVPGAARPTTWLAEIALRVGANARRGRRRRPEQLGGDEVDRVLASGSDPEQQAVLASSVARVQRCIDALDDDHRAVFLLYEVVGESTAGIASALDVPLGTVHSRLHSARKRFRAAWRRGASRDGEDAGIATVDAPEVSHE